MGEKYKERVMIIAAKVIVTLESWFKIAKKWLKWFFGEVSYGAKALFAHNSYKPKHMKKNRPFRLTGDRYHEQIGFNSIYKDAVR